MVFFNSLFFRHSIEYIAHTSNHDRATSAVEIEPLGQNDQISFVMINYNKNFKCVSLS